MSALVGTYFELDREELFAQLWSEISLPATDRGGQVLLVTSSWRSEGRSLVAAGLATAIANDLGSAVLVDLDWRKPALHQSFHEELSPGVTDVLAGRDLRSALRSVDGGRISLLTAGEAGEGGARLFSSARLEGLFEGLRGLGKVVVLDSPPVQAGALTCSLAAQADGTLLVVRAGRTLEREAKKVCDRLTSVQGVNLLGLVLNDVRE